MYELFSLFKAEKAEDEIPDAVGSPTKADDEDSQMLFQKKKVLKFRDSDMKVRTSILLLIIINQ